MQERIEKARCGRRFWLSLAEKYQIDNTVYVLILPSRKREYNEPALGYLKEFLNRRSVKKAFVLTYDPWVLEQGEKHQAYAEILECEEKQIESLLQFYCLYEFAQNIVVGSLEEPAGRMGVNLTGKKGLTPEEVFAGVVYSIVD